MGCSCCKADATDIGFSRFNSDKWQLLQSVPFKPFSKPVLIGDNKLLIIPSDSGSLPVDRNGIYLYNKTRDKWTKSISVPMDINSNVVAIGINKVTNTLSICNKPVHNLISTNKLDLTNNTFNSTKPLLFNIQSDSRLQIINGEVHIFTTYTHSIWSEKSNTVQKIYSSLNHLYLNGLCIIDIPSKERIILFNGPYEDIYLYAMETKSWRTLDTCFHGVLNVDVH